MRITILWSALAAYSVAFFRELALSQKCGLQMIYQTQDADAPYEPFDLSFCEDAAEDSPEIRNTLEARVASFAPDCILMISWTYPHFRRIARSMRRRGVYVVAAIDNQWRGTLKQYIGIFSSRWFLKPSIDTFLVAGDRQAQFAAKLRYEQVLYGYAAAEVEKFATAVPLISRPRAFLFAGRLISVKNLPRLAEAYRMYRDRVDDPWNLLIAGTGPFESAFQGVSGVEMLGFVQPDALPEVMQRARCLVLPSTLDQWGVVIHEAAAAGLPVIASHRCGAVSAFVRDGVNGFIVSPDAATITTALIRISEASPDQLLAMSHASRQLARLWTPSKLADYFCSQIRGRLNQPSFRDAHRVMDGPVRTH